MPQALVGENATVLGQARVGAACRIPLLCNGSVVLIEGRPSSRRRGEYDDLGQSLRGVGGPQAVVGGSATAWGGFVGVVGGPQAAVRGIAATWGRLVEVRDAPRPSSGENATVRGQARAGKACRIPLLCNGSVLLTG